MKVIITPIFDVSSHTYAICKTSLLLFLFFGCRHIGFLAKTHVFFQYGCAHDREKEIVERLFNNVLHNAPMNSRNTTIKPITMLDMNTSMIQR